MDLRTKLVFALVATALSSMAAVGALAYSEARDLLQDAAGRQLWSLAESRKQDLENVLDGWHDLVSLIQSRTQLRTSLHALEGGSERELGRIDRILEDARNSVRTVEDVAVYDPRGRLIARSPHDASPPPLVDLAPSAEDSAPRFLGLSTVGAARVARFVAPLREAGDLVGWLWVRLGTPELIVLSRDTTGLGRTGETLIAERTEDGGWALLHPPRHPAPPPTRSGRPVRGVDPVALAVAGRDTLLFEGAVDYRGQQVWAATRHLDAPAWGIVVKKDAAEEREPTLLLRTQIVRLATSVAAIAILVGVLLGLHLARPIHELAEVANRIREGDMAARAVVRSEDEVGALARVFNRMADVLTGDRDSVRDPRDPVRDLRDPPT